MEKDKDTSQNPIQYIVHIVQIILYFVEGIAHQYQIGERAIHLSMLTEHGRSESVRRGEEDVYII